MYFAYALDSPMPMLYLGVSIAGASTIYNGSPLHNEWISM